MDLFGGLPEPGDQACSAAPKRQAYSDDSEESAKKKFRLEDSQDASTEFCNAGELIALRGFVASRKGEREEMQDKHIIIERLDAAIPGLHWSIGRVSYYAVFDGHNGPRASKHCSERMHQVLADIFPKCSAVNLEKDARRVLTETFKRVDDEFLDYARKHKPAWKDGSTATLLVVVNNVLYIANVGDSKAILCRSGAGQKRMPLVLTKDHDPTEYAERMRIQKAGGCVKDGRVMGQLEVSRSIGDGQYKGVGVSSTPDIRKCQLLVDSDDYIVLACDGLWKVCSPDEVVRIVDEVLKGGEPDDTQESQDQLYEVACQKLVAEALRKLTGDNVTVMIIRLGLRPS